MKRSTTRKGPMKLLFPLAIAAMALGGTTKSADAHIEFEMGSLTSHQVPCATLCTTGTFTGGLAGTMDWTMIEMHATPNPDVVVLTGVLTVTTATGTMSGPDVTLWNLATGQFIDNTKLNSGSGAFAGVKGDLLIIGAFDLAGGEGASTYRAIVKTP
ncbi:MAG: hypothetical protein ABW133_16725 [Polyangiaceae bacterium]